MVKEFCLAWEKNKDKLKDYLANTSQTEYGEYESLVKLIFDLVINPEIDIDTIWHHNSRFATDDITVIDHGDYQGSLIFILHRNRYQPCVTDYVYTSVEYGSCSCCDTLQSIYDPWNTPDGRPSQKQLDDYMTLCLHLLQNCVMMKEE